MSEVAPVARAVIPADAPPESLAETFTKLEEGDRKISMPGSAWVQLQFANVDLGETGILRITGADGGSQSFNQQQIDDWGGLTAMFNGAEVDISLTRGEGAEAPVSADLVEIIVGLPEDAASPDGESPDRNLLSDFLGDIDRYRATDTVQPGQEGAQPASTESICGANDDRVATNNPRVGRLMPIGCTAWLIEGGLVLTAGHCTGAAAQTVHFNVPASAADGTPQAPAVRHQYRIANGSMVSQNTGIGNDWALFRLLPNTETALTAAAAQGAVFAISNTNNPAQVRIDGFGVDGPAPLFGAGPPRDATNQTLQTHAGPLDGNTGGANTGRLDYRPDTQGGNSGSPVIVEGTATAIGIHTNGGCTATGGANAGTSFRNVALWNAITNARRGTDDVLWQHINGQVHYWPMANGQRQGGINIAGLIGPEWRIIGAGDVDGSGTDDIIWQHINGQVHYWPMANGQRQGGINIAGPVGPEWRLIGAGDVNGDGTDDIIWQHINGQVHYWPMANGQRQGGINIAGIVGPEWRIIAAGDVDGSGTDDIIWQHINGQVHYWPMANGQRQGGINIAGIVGPEWRLSDTGDVNGDGTDDIIWQHINGQVHYWPMANGQRQGGINIAGLVGPEWRLIGAGGVD